MIYNVNFLIPGNLYMIVNCVYGYPEFYFNNKRLVFKQDYDFGDIFMLISQKIVDDEKGMEPVRRIYLFLHKKRVVSHELIDQDIQVRFKGMS